MNLNPGLSGFKVNCWGTSLVVQWLRLPIPNAGAQVHSWSGNYIPQAATKSSHAATKTWCSQVNIFTKANLGARQPPGGEAQWSESKGVAPWGSRLDVEREPCLASQPASATLMSPLCVTLRWLPNFPGCQRS